MGSDYKDGEHGGCQYSRLSTQRFGQHDASFHAIPHHASRAVYPNVFKLVLNIEEPTRSCRDQG